MGHAVTATYFNNQLKSAVGSIDEMEQSLYFDLTDFLYAKLAASSLKHKDLAKKVGMKESQISRILHADGNPTIKTIAKLFWALGGRPKILDVNDDEAALPSSPPGFTVDVKNVVAPPWGGWAGYEPPTAYGVTEKNHATL